MSLKQKIDRRDEVNFCDSIFGTSCQDELKEINKHEIIVKICEKLGPNPANFSIAEDIFENIKFEIARFVLHHEYGKENGIRSQLLYWLDSKINPDKQEKLANFINKYLK